MCVTSAELAFTQLQNPVQLIPTDCQKRFTVRLHHKSVMKSSVRIHPITPQNVSIYYPVKYLQHMDWVFKCQLHKCLMTINNI